MSTTRMSVAEYNALPGKTKTRSGDTPETALKKVCVAYLKLQGWISYPWFQQGMVPKNVRGMPDRVALKKGRHVWIEFKDPKLRTRPNGGLRPDQVERIQELRDAGAEVLVVYALEDLYVLGDERQMVMR